MEIRHIRIDNEKALTAKKDLLSSEINLLHILKKMNDYQKLRSKEFILKNKFKLELNSLKKVIGSFNSYLPEEVKIPKKIEKKKKIKKEHRDIQEELEEIKRKLEKLK